MEAFGFAEVVVRPCFVGFAEVVVEVYVVASEDLVGTLAWTDCIRALENVNNG